MKTEIEDRVNSSVAAEMKRLEGFRPLWGFVLVQIERAELSTGGIVLPEQRKERPCIGTVIAVGPDIPKRTVYGSIKLTRSPSSATTEPETEIPTKEDIPVINVGNRVLFGRYAGVEVELPTGEKLTSHRILRDVECYGVFK